MPTSRRGAPRVRTRAEVISEVLLGIFFIGGLVAFFWGSATGNWAVAWTAMILLVAWALFERVRTVVARRADLRSR